MGSAAAGITHQRLRLLSKVQTAEEPYRLSVPLKNGKKVSESSTLPNVQL